MQRQKILNLLMLQIAGLLFANPSSTASLAFNLLSAGVWNAALRGAGVALCLMFGRGVTHLGSAVTFGNVLRHKPIFIGLKVMHNLECNPNVGGGLPPPTFLISIGFKTS
jgi:hypothetical protein